ncbi:efflux RND transporter periplasmic adaptor subunit [Persephonella sp.]
MRILAGLIIGLILGGGIAFFVLSGNMNFLKNNTKPTMQSENLPKPAPISKKGIQQLFNIDTTVVEKKFLYKDIRAYGTVEHPENDLKDITFKISGYVEKLYADFTGKYIKKGEPLLSVYSPQLVSAQEEFLRAYRYYRSMRDSSDPVLRKSAEDLYNAAYKRLKYWDITDEQIENLKKTGKVQKTMTLYSPYDGWVMEKFVYLGSEVIEGKPVMRIAKHRNLWLIADLYEEDIRFVKKDQEVEFYFVSYPERIMKGKIDYIYPMMDEKKRTLKVRVVVDNSEKIFFPGMYGKVVIKVPIGESTVLPETAVLNTGKKKVVFVQTEKGVFEPVFVKIGVYTDGYYQILDGVHPGMIVANSALFLLDADAQLKGKYSKDKKPMEMMHHH